MIVQVIAGAWHDARYETLMRRARLHTVLADRAYRKAGYAGGFAWHQARASALIGEAIRHGHRSDHHRRAA